MAKSEIEDQELVRLQTELLQLLTHGLLTDKARHRERTVAEEISIRLDQSLRDALSQIKQDVQELLDASNRTPQVLSIDTHAIAVQLAKEFRTHGLEVMRPVDSEVGSAGQADRDRATLWPANPQAIASPSTDGASADMLLSPDARPVGSESGTIQEPNEDDGRVESDIEPESVASVTTWIRYRFVLIAISLMAMTAVLTYFVTSALDDNHRDKLNAEYSRIYNRTRDICAAYQKIVSETEQGEGARPADDSLPQSDASKRIDQLCR